MCGDSSTSPTHNEHAKPRAPGFPGGRLAVNDHEIDDEELAAFLDGRMDARGREAMMIRLAGSEEERDLEFCRVQGSLRVPVLRFRGVVAGPPMHLADLVSSGALPGDDNFVAGEGSECSSLSTGQLCDHGSGSV